LGIGQEIEWFPASVSGRSIHFIPDLPHQSVKVIHAPADAFGAFDTERGGISLLEP
jgi:hypothetical protein